MKINAEIAVYPLRQTHLSPAIDEVRDALSRHKLGADVGPLGTFVSGESAEVFAAIREAFDRDAAKGDVVMTVTLAKTA